MRNAGVDNTESTPVGFHTGASSEGGMPSALGPGGFMDHHEGFLPAVIAENGPGCADDITVRRRDPGLCMATLLLEDSSLYAEKGNN